MLTPTDMEDALQNIDRRLSSVEQILPTLATKADLERFATKKDLERFATREELQAVSIRAQVQIESLHDDVRLLAENLTRLYDRADSLTSGLASLTDRLERKGVI